MPALGIHKVNGVTGRSERKVGDARKLRQRPVSGRTRRSDLPLHEAVSTLLQERQLSVNALAKELGVSQPFLSRALRGVDKKRATPALIEAIARALSITPEYFLEYRRSVVIDHLQGDPVLTDKVYDQLVKPRGRRRSSQTR